MPQRPNLDSEIWIRCDFHFVPLIFTEWTLKPWRVFISQPVHHRTWKGKKPQSKSEDTFLDEITSRKRIPEQYLITMSINSIMSFQCLACQRIPVWSVTTHLKRQKFQCNFFSSTTSKSKCQTLVYFGSGHVSFDFKSIHWSLTVLPVHNP